MSDDDKDFIRGFACAVATLVRLFDEPTKARDIAHSNGFSLNDFKAAGVESFDLEPLRKAMQP